MSMFNEVFDDCPNCGKHSGYLQIDQLVLGFGEFDLADLGQLKARIASSFPRKSLCSGRGAG